MKEKEMAVAQILQQATTWITANELASQLHVSKRTIQNYIRILQKEKNIEILSSAQGYRMNHMPHLQQEKDIFPNTWKDRQHYLLKLMLTTPNDHDSPFLVQELEEELYVSPSTIKQDLQKARRRLQKFHLNLVVEKEQIWMEGEESDKRKLMSDILYEESHKGFMDTTFLQQSFPHLPISQISDRIHTILKAYQFFLNDYAYMNFLLHVAITIDRMKGGFPSFPISDTNLLSKHHLMIAKEIAQSLEQLCQITLDDNELNQMCLMLLPETSMHGELFSSSIQSQYTEFIQTLLVELKDWYNVELEEKDFTLRFALHIHHLMLRCQLGKMLHNPLSQHIKMNCPLIYEIAIYISTKLQEVYDIKLSDDEIAYIALHIGGGIENKKRLEDKLKCYLFAPEYHDLSLQLANQIRANFDDTLWIVDILENPMEQITSEPVDLLISTHELDSIAMKMVWITPFLTAQDRSAIQKAITELQKEKEERVFQTQLQHFFFCDLFTIDSECKLQDQVISQMCTRLLKYNYVDHEFEQEILQREELSSTAFGLVAIPHSMKMNAKQTAIYPWINPKGILWGESSVQVVMMLVINQDNRAEFKNIFQHLTKLFLNQAMIEKLSHVTSYQEFLTALSSYR